MDLLTLFEAARRVSVPILAIQTSDQFATVAELQPTVADHALLRWDAARGLTPVNKLGEQALSKLSVTSQDTIGFVEALIAAAMLPEGAIVFAHNAHRQLQSQEPAGTAAAVQAVANLRDQFKVNWRTLVLLGPSIVLPTELEQDVVVLNHALPGSDALSTIIKELHQAAKLTVPIDGLLTKAVDAVSGLSAFAAEQVTAMSLGKDGLDLAALWERKRVAIEQTRGLSVWRGGERFDDLIGLGAIKAHLRLRAKARTPVGVVVWLDEIDKVLANVEGDTSGVRMDQLRTLLTEMENHDWRGLVAVGVPGGGKSAIAKAFGNEVGVPTVAIDLGGMESKYVGESEAQLRQAMQIVRAVGGGHAYVIATSNNASVMRPELQRRFTDGMWFFDLMTDAEREAAIAFYVKRYTLNQKQLLNRTTIDMNGWTGAEVRNLCCYAWDTGASLSEAAPFVVPMARSRADEIEKLRLYANGRFLDANRPGPYQYTPEPMARQVRAIELGKAVR